MNTLQVILIALFIYLGAIGSIVGNTLGWYCVGRPLIAAFVVGLIMGDMSTAMLVGIPLQIAYLANVTPGGAVSWDLSYATYIGTAMAIALKGTVGDEAALVGLAFTGAGVGGMVGGTMWNVHYALDVFVNRWANKIAESGETKKMWMPNIIGGQIIGFLCCCYRVDCHSGSRRCRWYCHSRLVHDWYLRIWLHDGCSWNGYHPVLPGKERGSLGHLPGRLRASHLLWPEHYGRGCSGRYYCRH